MSSNSSSNVVGVHYRLYEDPSRVVERSADSHSGRKIGEGSFGVIFEGTNLLNNQQVAIKFVSRADRYL